MNIILISLFILPTISGLNLNYLDPVKLQTKTSPDVQKQAASKIISKYLNDVDIYISPLLFADNKDVFVLRTTNGQLKIRASSGVAAVWGFNYYLKKYCKSQIAWQVQRVTIPSPLPEVDETVIANDRFRYYQNVCTASYSFVWWDAEDWSAHVEWMALNGINLALAPVAQEAIWASIYKQVGMGDEEIDEYFTGPGFLSWLRMGNVHGWGGPLFQSWHNLQRDIQENVVGFMFELGMIPVLPAFNGHVPRAFARIFPNATFYSVTTWNRFGDQYCCNLFVSPSDPQFKAIGRMFLKMTEGMGTGNIYSADPFNEIKVEPWSTALVQQTARAIHETLTEYDDNAVWLLQNWMFVHNPLQWPLRRVEAFLGAVPSGRLLVVDLQAEQWPQFELYRMYFGHPFIWSMLHNFGGTLGLFGSLPAVNRDVHRARKMANTTMIGVGLTPEGINQNYVVYDFMLETAWRPAPVGDLGGWVAQYAERRYGCNATAAAWRHLLRSVYSFDGLNKVRGKYAVTRRPSFKIRPWAWYESKDLVAALQNLLFSSTGDCAGGFELDLVDVTRQLLQYRADQLYLRMLSDRSNNMWAFNASIGQFLDVMTDMETTLATSDFFSTSVWLSKARSKSANEMESYMYEFNARNQITLWGPNGEITDYACKQWAEMFHYYYTPRWTTFLNEALNAKARNEPFDERSAQRVIRSSVEEKFQRVTIETLPRGNARSQALYMYQKWAFVSDLEDLPMSVIPRDPQGKTTIADVNDETEEGFDETPSVILWHSTTPT